MSSETGVEQQDRHRICDEAAGRSTQPDNLRYGHLNEAYYLVVFSNATWSLQDHFGIGSRMRATQDSVTLDARKNGTMSTRHPAGKIQSGKRVSS